MDALFTMIAVMGKNGKYDVEMNDVLQDTTEKPSDTVSIVINLEG